MVQLAITSIINSTQAVTNLWEVLPPEISSGISFLITLSKAIGIVVLIYFSFLLLRLLFSIKGSRKINSITKNLEEINQKLNTLIQIQKQGINPIKSIKTKTNNKLQKNKSLKKPITNFKKINP